MRNTPGYLHALFTHEELTEVFTPEMEALAAVNRLIIDKTIDKLTQLF